MSLGGRGTNGRLDGWSLGLGAVAGVLAAGAALGAGQFVAGLTGASGSPVVVVGELQIDFTPPWLKNFAISEFGADDKLVLVSGILVVLGVFAAVIGLRNYFHGGNAPELSNDLIDVVLDHGARMPSLMSAIHLHLMGGAAGRVSPGTTWTDPAEDSQHIGTNRDLAAQLALLAQDGSYVNFLTDTAGDSNARVRAAYGDALYERLARLKREFDPGNLFRANHNIRPAR